MSVVGIYGGTFAPVHNGHVAAVHYLAGLDLLDRLLLIPTRRPPHKALPRGDDPAHRLAMLRLAFPEADEEGSRLSISEFELTSSAPGYTALTLTHFASGKDELIFFCGSDMFLSLASWYHPATVFSLATVAHLPRTVLTEEEKEAITERSAFYRRTYGARLLTLPFDPVPLSSTAVRAALRTGKPIDGMVPEAVAAYIRRHRLYEEASV